MKVTPMTDKAADDQAKAFGLWPRGLYDFEVVEAKERVSKAGNDMIELVVKVYNPEGRYRQIFDYLVETDATGYKLRHFAKAVNLLAQYEKGELSADDCVGRTGRCQLAIKKDNNGVYPDKNVIQDYEPVVHESTKPLVSTGGTTTNKDFDDEIPF